VGSIMRLITHEGPGDPWDFELASQFYYTNVNLHGHARAERLGDASPSTVSQIPASGLLK
jgi:hypothetical protein